VLININTTKPNDETIK